MHKQLSSPRSLSSVSQDTDALSLFFESLPPPLPGTVSPVLPGHTGFEAPSDSVAAIAESLRSVVAAVPEVASSVPSSVAVDALGQGLKRTADPDRGPPAKRVAADSDATDSDATDTDPGTDPDPGTTAAAATSNSHSRTEKRYRASLTDSIAGAQEEEKMMSDALGGAQTRPPKCDSKAKKINRMVALSVRAREEITRNRKEIRDNHMRIRLLEGFLQGDPERWAAYLAALEQSTHQG